MGSCAHALSGHSPIKRRSSRQLFGGYLRGALASKAPEHAQRPVSARSTALNLSDRPLRSVATPAGELCNTRRPRPPCLPEPFITRHRSTAAAID